MAKKARKNDESGVVDHDQAVESAVPAAVDRAADYEVVEMARIRRDPKNENTHPPEQIAALKASLVEFKQTKPLIVNRRNGQIVAGNGTFTAMQQLGWSHAKVQWVDWTAKQQRDYRIIDNRASQMSSFDPDLLQLSLAEMQAESSELFDAMELSELLVVPPAVVEPSPSNNEPEPDLHAVFVECGSEEQQKELITLLKKRGFKRTRTLTSAEGKALASVTGGGE